MGGTFHTLEQIRIVADLVSLIVGAVPIVFATLLLVVKRHLKSQVVT